jgi:hypothetical protein
MTTKDDPSTEAPSRAMTKADEATPAQRLARVPGAYSNAKELAARLRYAQQYAHLISPTTQVAAVPEGFEVTIASVVIDPNETYAVEDKRGLSKVALDRIASAAGVSWDSHLSRRLDDEDDALEVDDE